VGVDISDLNNSDEFIHANWWQWRPTVEIIRTFDMFDEERLDLLSNGIGEFSRDEALAISEYLEIRIFPKLNPNHRILLDGTITDTVDDGTFYRDLDQQHRNYSVDYDWLVKFTAFCKQSNGLYIC
jgi:hypothetical protein